jgi:hypothetical protein
MFKRMYFLTTEAAEVKTQSNTEVYLALIFFE